MVKKLLFCFMFSFLINLNETNAQVGGTVSTPIKFSCSRTKSTSSSAVNREFAKVSLICTFDYYLVRDDGGPSYSSSSTLVIPAGQSSVSTTLNIQHSADTHVRVDSVHIAPSSLRYDSGYANKIFLPETSNLCIQSNDHPQLIVTHTTGEFVLSEVAGKFYYRCHPTGTGRV